MNDFLSAGMMKQCTGNFRCYEFESSADLDCFLLSCLFVCVFSEYCDILVFGNEASCVKNELPIVVRHLIFAISSRSSYALKDVGPNLIGDVIYSQQNLRFPRIF